MKALACGLLAMMSGCASTRVIVPKSSESSSAVAARRPAQSAWVGNARSIRICLVKPSRLIGAYAPGGAALVSLHEPFATDSGSRFDVPRVRSPNILQAYPQPWYVAGEHTATGYTPGHYRRDGNYTRGEHTSRGYTPGHYRSDGNYTRGEHTPRGYVPGHYRAQPQPVFRYSPASQGQSAGSAAGPRGWR